MENQRGGDSKRRKSRKERGGGMPNPPGQKRYGKKGSTIKPFWLCPGGGTQSRFGTSSKGGAVSLNEEEDQWESRMLTQNEEGLWTLGGEQVRIEKNEVVQTSQNLYRINEKYRKVMEEENHKKGRRNKGRMGLTPATKAPQRR